MPKLTQAFLCLALIALSWLALKPYWPQAQVFFEDFQQAWMTLKAPQKTNETPADKTPTTSPRERAIHKPTERVHTDLQTSDAVPSLRIEALNRAAIDPAGTLAWLQEMEASPERLESMLEVVALWASNDAEATLLWLEAHARGSIRTDSLASGMTLWGQKDPQAAASWLEGMANDGSKRNAAASLAKAWGTTSPGDAGAWIRQLPNGPIRDEAASALIQIWAQTAPLDAAVWALSEAEFMGNRTVLDESIAAYTRQNHTKAEAFVREIADAFETPEGLESYLRTRAQLDPESIMTEMQSWAPNDPINRPENAATIMQEWSRLNSVAASAWLGEMPPGPRKDAAITGFAETMLQYEPEAAAEWTNAISSPKQRVQQLYEIVQTWAQTQPMQAMEWVKSAHMEPDLRDQLASEIPWD